MKPIRVLIVDDRPQVRQDLCTLLPLAGDFQVVGEAANGAEAIEQATVLQPDVILMDLEMPMVDGYEATRQIKARRSACRIVALSIHTGEAARHKAAQAGVDGFIEKGAPLSSLLQAMTLGR
ncbi:MAG: response regulator transcription factor [Anaerolineae bacterium]